MRRLRTSSIQEWHQLPNSDRDILFFDVVALAGEKSVKVNRGFPYDFVLKQLLINITTLLLPCKYGILFDLDQTMFCYKLSNVGRH